MNGTEFAYWLQGHFELDDGDNKVEPLTIKQVDTIRKHHQLAKITSPNDPFLNLMEGLLEGFNLIDAHCEDSRIEVIIFDMRIWVTDCINDKLQEKFKNVTSGVTGPNILDLLPKDVMFDELTRTCSLMPPRGTTGLVC